MSRRANKEEPIVKRFDGRYQVAYYVLTPDGRRKRKFIYAKTRSEANVKLLEL